MPPNTPEGRIKIIAENLARAALAEFKRDVEGTGTAAGGASTGFGKMVFQHGQLIASTQGARRGLNILENGIRSLAFSAAGIPGPVGKMAAGVGMLGAGSLVVTSFVAGAGAVALGYRLITRDAREASEAADKVTESVKKQTLGGQFRGISANLTEASEGVASAQRRQEAPGLTTVADWVAWIRQGALTAAGEKAVDAVLAVRDARAKASGDMIRDLQREAQLIGATTEEAARLKASWLGLTEAETANYVAAAVRLERRKEENRALQQQKNLLEEIADISRQVEAFALSPDTLFMLGQIQTPTVEGLRFQETERVAGLQLTEMQKQAEQWAFELPQSFFDDVQAGVNEALGDIDGLQKGGKDAGMVMAQAFVLALGQFQHGGAGGVAGGFGALLTGAGELKGAPSFLGPVGFAFSALSTVIGMFDRSAERRQREQMEELRRIRENTDKRGQPQSMSFTLLVNGREIAAELVGDVVYLARRLERTNAEPILPP